MSHNKDYTNNAPLEVSGCPTAPYVPGSYYLITDLDQGNLEDFSVLALAIDTTTLDANVTVNEGWPGIIDWADCQLVYLQDNFGNQVFGKSMITNFSWLNSDFTNNYIGQISSFDVDPVAVDSFKSNYIYGTETVVSITEGTNTVDNNTFGDSSIVRSDTADVIASIINNRLHGDTTLEFTGAGTHLFNGNEVHSSNIVINSIPTNVHDNIIQNSNINLQTSDVPITIEDSFISGQISLSDAVRVGDGQIAISRSTVTGGSNVTFSINTENISEIITLSMLFIDGGSSVNFSGGNGPGDAVTFESSTITGTSSINIPTITGPINLSRLSMVNNATVNVQNGIGSHINVFVENGTLNTGGFDSTSIKLEAADSTLIANVLSATKSGYVGALP